MASLQQALDADVSGYVPVEPDMPRPPLPSQDTALGYNPRLRCPLPPTSSATSDSLRQFYKPGVAQIRLIPPTTTAATVSSGTTVNNVIVNSSSSSSSSTSSAIVALQTGITTPAINSGQKFTGALTIARSYQLIGVTANVACRVRLYGTSAAQTQDVGRALDYPPAPGTTQNLISDLALDTAPYQWSYQNRIGANGDSPQKQLVYVTITNISSGTAAITLSLTYIALEA